MTPTEDQFADVILGMPEDAFGKDGSPKIKPLNAALKDADYDTMTSGQRDAFWTAFEARSLPPEDDEPAPETAVVLIRDAMCNPVPVYVHGQGSWKIRIGVEQEVPLAAIDALRDSDVDFTILGVPAEKDDAEEEAAE